MPETTKPIAPTTMRMTPTVESLKPWPEVVVTAQYRTAPTAIEMALKTIPVRPISVTSIRKVLANCQVSKEAGSGRLQPSGVNDTRGNLYAMALRRSKMEPGSRIVPLLRTIGRRPWKISPRSPANCPDAGRVTWRRQPARICCHKTSNSELLMPTRP